MRFLPRSAEPVEPLDAAPHQHGQRELPLKARSLLGEQERKPAAGRQRGPPETYVPTGSPPRRDNQTSPSPMLPPLNPTEPLSLDEGLYSPAQPYSPPNPLKSNPPTGNGRMSPFPTLQAPPKLPQRTTSANDLRSQQPNAYAYTARQPQRGPPNALSPSAVQPHQFYPDSKPSIESFETKMREYYDSSTQPLSVSQQTSASAVRDHGLRKGSPMIAMHETSSDPTLAKSQRPLKSAMKKSQQENARRRDAEKKGRKLDIGSLFAQQHKPASPGNSSPSQSSRTGRDLDFFPEQTVRAKLQRPRPHARYETQKSLESNSSERTVRERAKVFENDIYDNNKMHVRRPPKGIQNWFDGFDISSDEEERMWVREKEKVKREPPPVELPATEALQAKEALPSTFSPYDGAFKQRQQQRPQRPAHTRKASTDPVEDNVLAIEHAREMMKRRAQRQPSKMLDAGPTATTSASGAKQHRESESRLAHSRLGSQSVLSLSSESENGQNASGRRGSVGDESVVLGNAASVGMHYPDVPPREVRSASGSEHPDATLRRSISTTKTSGSIPMRLGSDVPMPPMPADHHLVGSPPRHTDSPAQALRRLNGLSAASQTPRSRRTTRSAPDDSRSNADRSIAEETTSSATDGSRTMQVSEEEMILLELMRQKRAAMQKNSFSEGYRLALKQEHDHLEQRREGAHRTALQILKAKEEMAKRQSATSTVFSEDHENPALAAMRRKYSALHREDVDKALKLERFLSLDPHGHIQAVPGADRFPAPPIVVDDEAETTEAEDDPPVLLQARTYSPMQKLTQKVRDRGSRSAGAHSASPSASTSQTTPPDVLSEESLEEHHDRVRAFLASNSASEAQGLFPTPPNHARGPTRHEDWQRKAGRVMSPSPVQEEEAIPDDSESEPLRARDSRFPEPLQPRRYEPKPRKHSPRQPADARQPKYRLSYTPDSDPLLETIGGLAPPSSSHRLRDPYPEITPTLDSAPLELPSVGFPGSPSLSSRPSPVTPTFPQVPSHHHHHHHADKTVGGGGSGFVEIAGSSAASDNASWRGGSRRAYTPDTDFSGPLPASTKKPSKRGGPPPVVASDAGGKRGAADRSSTGMSSITSASDDVLAAWAELGGGTADFRKVGGRGGR